MIFGEYYRRLRSGNPNRRPRKCLVVSGPEGCGKNVLTKALLQGLDTQECTEQDLMSDRWEISTDRTVCVVAEGTGDITSIAAIKALLTHNMREVNPKGEQRYTQPTPWGIVVHTLDPEKYRGPLFVHISIGGDEYE